MRDLAFGVGMLVVAGGVYAMAAAIPQSDLADVVGPSGLPKAYAVALAVLSLLLIGRVITEHWLRPSVSRVAAVPRRPVQLPWRALATLLAGVVYLVVVPWLGYPLSLAALIAATTVSQGGTISRHVAVVASSGAAFLWLLFVWLLDIQHPTGVWSSLF